MRAGGLPWPVLVAGYVALVVVYAFFALFTLFITAALDDDAANLWLLESAVTTVVTGLLVQPVTTAGAASFAFVNEVVFTALARLIVSMPV